jgi:formate/nitrite transporter FocA (FNT family)
LDYVSPLELTSSMLESGAKKANLSVSDMLIRGAFAGALLGMAATLSDAATVATGDALVGAIMFSFGFVIIALLNLELFTGCCVMLPFAAFGGRATGGQVLRTGEFVNLGTLIGSLLYPVIYAAATT